MAANRYRWLRGSCATIVCQLTQVCQAALHSGAARAVLDGIEKGLRGRVIYGTTSSGTATAPIMPTGMSEPDPAWQLPALLGELKRRRFASIGTNNPIEQTAIAEEMGVHPSHVSRLESGTRKLANVPGDQLYKFLRGYRFTPLDIKGIVAANGFNIPPQLINGTAEAPLGTVMVMHEGTVTRPGESGQRPVQEEFLRGNQPHRVRLRTVATADLATARAQELVKVGTDILYQPGGKAVSGSIVILEADGKQALAMWPLEATGEWAHPYGASPHAPIRLDKRSTLIGVALGGYTPFPTGS